MSKEELSERREENTSFYKDNIPHLTVQAEYEALLADIEKSRAERMQAQMFPRIANDPSIMIQLVSFNR